MILPAKFVRTALLTVAVSAVCVVGASAASVGAGTVNTDALRLREEANSSSTILATASKGDVVVILEEESNGWYKVDYKSVEGYMSADYLDVSTKADVTIGYGLVETDGSPLNVRSGPGTDYDKVTSLNDGAVVTIVGIDNGWYKVKTSGGSVGYVSSDYMVTCKDSAGSRGDGTVVAASSSLGQQVVDYAAQFLGTPYVYGGNGPNSFDCSGFTSYVYRHFGYTLNRTATGQLSNGVSVSKSELQPGDLVFFKSGGSKPVSHVGIYVGGGQFIHASTNTYEVRYDNLTSGYYNNVYVYARRVL
ncbi:SH3 domain-containing C40 family peptidase [Pseudoflavonifractor phocaeensis]|uniref:C40 family peptidase n=1 Tax=Pseudoflavonifractor phocaeensis TaxID=1870988 RepID=UPI0019577BC4|nr:SH3 domain-containing C40 family peptidase [Pseudoflavonifractor phocaeensis]MBM6723520.1 C40 family peptidase [Pseudoflavonifractor phocaeensis]